MTKNKQVNSSKSIKSAQKQQTTKGPKKTPMSRAERKKQSLQRKAQNESVKVEKKKEIVQEVKKNWGTHTSTSVLSAVPIDKTLDQLSMLMMIEVLMAEFATNTDIFISIKPYEFVYYLMMITYAYIKRAGTLGTSTSSAVPLALQDQHYPVPISFAKWLQGLGRYAYCGIMAQTAAVTPLNFVPNNMGWGSQTTFQTVPGVATGAVSRFGLPNWYFMQQTVYIERKNIRFLDEILPYEGNTWYDFMGNNDQIGKVAQTFSRSSTCVSLGRISAKAPNASAYAYWAGADNFVATPTAVPTTGTWQCNFPRYHTEEAILYNIGSLQVTELLTTHSKPLTKNIFNYDVIAGSYPWYSQPFATLTYVQKWQKKLYRGPIIGTLWFGGMKLRSLFCQDQYIDGNFLTQVALQSYKTLLANKSQKTNTDDPNLTNLTLLNIMAYYTFQRQMSTHEVNHVNIPACNNANSNITVPTSYYPQYNYTESSWSTYKIPALMATLISKLAPVNQKGILRIPITSFVAKVVAASPTAQTILPNNYVPGPYNWSAFGYKTQPVNAFYEYVKNIYTLSVDVATGTSVTAFPQIMLFNTGITAQDVQLNPAYYAQTCLIWDNPTNAMYLQPYTLNGQSAEAVNGQFETFVNSVGTTNQPPMISVQDSGIGALSLMDTKVKIETDLQDILPAQSLSPGVNSSANGAPTGQSSYIGEVHSGTSLSPVKAAIGVIFQQGVEADPKLADNGAIRPRSRYDLIQFHSRVNGLPLTKDPPPPPFWSSFSLDFPSGAGWLGMLRTVTDNLLQPGSKFANSVEAIRQSVEHIGTFKPRNRAGPLSLSQSHQSGLHPLLQSVLQVAGPTLKQIVRQIAPPAVQPHTIGLPGLNKLNPDQAKAVQTMVPRTDIAAQDTIEEHPKKKSFKDKLKDGFKIVGSAAVKAGKIELERNLKNVSKVMSNPQGMGAMFGL